jgi:HD superfamily phosphohydrolase YqeK
MAQVYIGVVVATAAVLVARGPFGDIAWIDVLVLGLLLVVSDSAATLLRVQNLAWSANSVAVLAAIVLVGPVGAALVGIFSLLTARRRLSGLQRLFNAGMMALTGYLPGQIYLAMDGKVGVPTARSFPTLIGVFAVVAVVHVLVNYSLLEGALWLSRAPSQGILLSLDLRMGLTELGYCAFGLLIAALWGELQAFAPVLVLVPLLVARWAVAQFAAQQRAYEATVSALCQAVETKDFYTRGHSDRVSRGSVMIAREIGMHGDRVEALRYAGMLHDVGKLGVPTRVLQKTGKLTDEEYAAIQLHPMRGLEIVREIGFLDEAMAGIMHHHERIDGRGYPMGLAGDEIPEFARVLAVADAFDSMTSTRSYRGARPVADAIEELRKWSGTQFDPAFVDAFVAAVRRDGWQQPDAPVLTPDEVPSVTAQDHDDPTAPLRVIDSY